jgi:hypothetical protein
MSAMQEDWAVLRSMFPEGWLQLGRDSGAVTRLRGFDSVDDLLRTLLMHVGCGWSLRETVVRARLAGIADVSDVTLLNRLRQSTDWLRQLCQQLWIEAGLKLDTQNTEWPIRVMDATVVKEPGKTGSQWRIHYSMRLPSLACDHFDLTPAEGTGTGEKLGRFHFRQGELVLADAGYSNSAGVAAVHRDGAYLCMRLNPKALPLQQPNGKRFPLLSKVRTLRQAGQTGEWAVWVESGGNRLQGRLCAIRKSQTAIDAAQRRLLRKAQKKQCAVAAKTQEYACYVMVFTTLPAQKTKASQVLEYYRLRWQIELTFKRLKSIVQLGHVPKRDDDSSRAWLYGKLFLALLSEKLIRTADAISPWGYPQPAAAIDPEPLA